MASPLKAFLNIKRKELPLVLLMFAYFFSVITTFWIVKPIKKAKFVGHYKGTGGLDLLGWHLDGAQAEQLAKVANMMVAFLAVVAFTWLARRLRRQQLTLVFCAFCAALFVGFGLLGGELGEAGAWAFYLYGDLYNTLMVATFFAFLNDSFSPEGAKRNYGPIVLGGVTGGAFGSMFVQFQVDAFSFSTWMWICTGITAAIAAVGVAAGRIVAADPPPEAPPADAPPPEAGKQANAAVEGARLVSRSRYLLAIVAIVGLYEIVSTVLDFQFTAATLHYVAREDLDNHFTTVFAITNSAALFIQLFLTSYVLGNFPHTVALLVMPFAVLLSSTGFLVAPGLWMGAALSISDNSLNYSLNQSAREALYTPTSRDEKYKAKAFIDMFVQRFAKALAVGVALLITTIFTTFSSVRFLSVFTIAIAAIWTLAARYAGRRFTELTSDAGPAAGR